MLLKNLTKVYISKAKEIKDHGENDKKWSYISIAFLNLQQDINELDTKSTGEVNYDIYKARTDIEYDITAAFKELIASSKDIPILKYWLISTLLGAVYFP